jgi:AcrR family transcriptional regulator
MAQKKHQTADTKESILSAAESPFMERSYAATSLRMNTAKAKVNLAAVRYHSGSIDAPIREVFERRPGPLIFRTHCPRWSGVRRSRPAALRRADHGSDRHTGPAGEQGSARRRRGIPAVAVPAILPQDRRRFRPRGCLRPIHGLATLGARK